ncbi:MarR family transcriptional regulator [Photobacterium aquae]|uniref:MarR family transcriptional regulator n=1 Tax=Photobacterium aquae TaxID=1195763 RepID=A0A0J1HD97_9GAMM|nr:MarR family transcriptional regulator [Photobacterium aquae]KLV09610.1 MarR family transcriptional regulator [Photobacterium aquae]
MSITINDIPELENNMSFMMGLAYKQFRTLANQVLAAEWDITLEMLGALRVLAHRGEIPQQALAEALHRERSVTKRLVDNCIKRGLVVARKSETNKKARYLALTEQGQETKTQAHQRLQAIVADYYAPLSADEQRLLLSLCKKLIKDDVIIGAD